MRFAPNSPSINPFPHELHIRTGFPFHCPRISKAESCPSCFMPDSPVAPQVGHRRATSICFPLPLLTCSNHILDSFCLLTQHSIQPNGFVWLPTVLNSASRVEPKQLSTAGGAKWAQAALKKLIDGAVVQNPSSERLNGDIRCWTQALRAQVQNQIVGKALGRPHYRLMRGYWRPEEP